MTTITTDPRADASLGSVLRAVLVAIAVALVAAAFVTGRMTAPTETEIIRSVVAVPVDDVGDAVPCRLGEPC